ncbi:MAG: ribonuclease 3 [Alphaproteobacteria bacterium]|nr:MAG: ribonuclease 3 [Alphaproteobacteria bacterium]
MPSSASSRERGKKRFGNLEKRLGYEFSDYADVERALTHASVRKKADDRFHYERLEFLGDRVLGLAIADLLHRRFPEADEGELSLRLNALVRGKTLAAIADELHLHEFIRTGSDLKEITGKRMQSVRADVLEALIASIYLDGGLEAASAFINRFWVSRLDDEAAARRDSKTELQEWAHANRKGTPKYREVERSGPDHDPVFTVAVRIDGLPECVGSGRSKRTAEQAAARAMLMREGVRGGGEAAA